MALALLFLYGFTAYQARLVLPWSEIVVVLLIIGAIYSIGRETKALDAPDEGAMGILACIKNFVCVLIGVALAYTLNVEIGIGAVLAASLVSMMAAILLPSYSVSIALGGFVGMTSSRLLIGYAELYYAATIAGLLYLYTDRVFNGFGGKLGVIAFVGTFITGSGLSREFEITPFPEWEAVVAIILIPDFFGRVDTMAECPSQPRPCIGLWCCRHYSRPLAALFFPWSPRPNPCCYGHVLLLCRHDGKGPHPQSISYGPGGIVLRLYFCL